MKNRLRKIDYIDYLRCPPEFWLKVKEPLLFGLEEHKELEYKHLRQQGYDVEWFVKQREQFQSTESRFVDFQRIFQTEDFFCRTDIVVTDYQAGTIDIYEVKASSSVKDEHYDDIAFQKMVAEKCGIAINRCHLVTMNGDYVRAGEIDPEQLFSITDVTDEVERRLAATEKQAYAAIRYLDTVPVVTLMDYCKKNKLNCKFIQYSFPDLPEYTIFDITYLKNEKRKELLDLGIVSITDVPDDFKLSEKQRRQVAAAKSGAVEADIDAIQKRMESWQFPLHFLDYETFAYAVPQFDGVKPFQQMCFQFSLHTIDSPGAEPRHQEYLVRDGEPDPPRAMAEKLREAMSGEIGTVLVWYEGFETTRNAEMAVMFPDLADFFNEVNAKTVDLMKIFADRLYIHPEFKGRSSIKKVLPVLCPDLDYQRLGIKEGMTASISWFHAATRQGMDLAERERIFNDLRDYCELDTWAMVRIYYFLLDLNQREWKLAA